MLCRCYHASALGGRFAAEVNAGLVTLTVFTTLLATDVSSFCIMLSRLGILGGGFPPPPRVFLLWFVSVGFCW